MILKHVNNILFRSASWLLTCAVFASIASVSGSLGCSTSASAPPVSLPAPVTGRLTVSSPDETGAALVVGDDGSVAAGSLVHGVNETQATASLIDLSDVVAVLDVFPAAEAQAALPAICSSAFHACAIADAAGSFEIQLQASDDDAIGVEVLDTVTGIRISERTHHNVPHNVRFFVRPVLGVGLLENSATDDHKLYALMGNTPAEARGLVSIVDLPTRTRTVVAFDGTHPTAMTVQRETHLAAVLDGDGNFIAKVDLTTNNFDAPTKITIAAPRDLILNGGGNSLFVGTANDAAVIRKIDFGPFTPAGNIVNADLQALIPGITNIATGSLDVTPFTTTLTFDLVAFAGLYSVGGVDTPAVGLLDGTTMSLIALTPLPAGAVAHDVAFFVTQNKLLVTDTGNNQILVYNFSTDHPLGTTSSLTLEGSVADPNGFVVTPRDIVVDPAAQLAFITAKNGNETRPDTVLTLDLATEQLVDISPIGLGPTGLVYDFASDELFVSTFKSRSITNLGLAELLP